MPEVRGGDCFSGIATVFNMISVSPLNGHFQHTVPDLSLTLNSQKSALIKMVAKSLKKHLRI